MNGVPITQYCDDNQLTIRERLELFVPVCQAIQHAHQKGVIHRDIKPSNVLVMLCDGKPVPKVIDFGIAKAVDPKLTELTLFRELTEVGALVGTLEYMSPEQADLDNLDIDTRSDIYSLGVLLYEMLTGTLPQDWKHLKEKGLLKALRLIREEEPPRPSTRLHDSETLPSIAASRKTEPVKLAKLVRGELDWIVMKALEKDRNCRYETANGLARNVEHYLADEPVEVVPPSAGYRLRKLARRNSRALAIAGSILLFLVSLGAVFTWVVHERATRQAKAAKDFELALERADVLQEQGKRMEALAVLDRAELLVDEIPSDSALKARLTALEERLAADERDQQFLARFEEIRLNKQSRVLVKEGRLIRWNSTFPAIRDALHQYGIDIGGMAPAQVAARIQGRPELIRHNLIAALDECFRYSRIDYPQARQWLLDTLKAADEDAWRRRARKAMTDRDWKALQQMACEVDMRKQPPSFVLFVAESFPEELNSARLELLRRIQREYPADLWANRELANVLSLGHPAEAIRYYTAALALRPDDPGMYYMRAHTLNRAGELDAAITDSFQAIRLAPQYYNAHNLLGSFLRLKKRWDEAIREFQTAIDLEPTFLPAYYNLVDVHVYLGRWEEV
jgi:tetratricopeptide (TPR) repeat protein